MRTKMELHSQPAQCGNRRGCGCAILWLQAGAHTSKTGEVPRPVFCSRSKAVPRGCVCVETESEAAVFDEVLGDGEREERRRTQLDKHHGKIICAMMARMKRDGKGENSVRCQGGELHF